MLFVQTNNLAISANERERLRLFDALAAKGFAPFISTTRRHLFELMTTRNSGAPTAPTDAATRLERECVAEHESRGGAYTPGEIFCDDDCVFTLVFGQGADEGVSAGVIYNVETAEPLAKLERFCRDVRATLGEIREAKTRATGAPPDMPGWHARSKKSPPGLARFMAMQPAGFARAAAALRGGRELTRASALLEEPAVRLFLRRAQEMRREGFTPRRLFTEADGLGAGGVAVERMLEAGLLEREVRVSCRKSGHALFDLPSPDSLAAITISRAKCSLCAAPVADEVIEETINPTRLAVALLEDGRWLTNRVYKIIRALGIPDSEIATAPASTHGESQLAVDVCGNSFLFVTRDGDLTPAFCRRIVETVEETGATHLVVVITGAVEEEGRLRLYEYVWRRARGGQDLSTTLIEGLNSARAEIERSFTAAVRRELSRSLFTLDAALGFSAGGFVLDWFKLLKASGAKNRATTPTVPENIGAQRFVDLDRQIAS